MVIHIQVVFATPLPADSAGTKLHTAALPGLEPQIPSCKFQARAQPHNAMHFTTKPAALEALDLKPFTHLKEIGKLLANPSSYPVRVSYFPHPAFKFAGHPVQAFRVQRFGDAEGSIPNPI